MGRILAIDLGDVRVGLALSDPLGFTAQPLPTLRGLSGARLERRVAELVRTHEVARVVVGYPLLMSGEVGKRAEEARAFAGALGRRLPGVVVDLWDERLTTVQAERAMAADGVRGRRRRGMVDEVAAALILQSYLDARRAADGSSSTL